MTILDPADAYMVLINTFTVEPDKAEALLAELSNATTLIRQRPGFVSANLHISEDRTRVANYAQWRTRADFDAFIGDPKSKAHLKQSADLATSFDPIMYELREAASADAPV